MDLFHFLRFLFYFLLHFNLFASLDGLLQKRWGGVGGGKGSREVRNFKGNIRSVFWPFTLLSDGVTSFADIEMLSVLAGDFLVVSLPPSPVSQGWRCDERGEERSDG